MNYLMIAAAVTADTQFLFALVAFSVLPLFLLLIVFLFLFSSVFLLVLSFL